MRVLSVLRGSAGLDEYPLLRALLAAGCDLINLDDRHYGFHEVPNAVDRAARRFNRAAYVHQINADLMRYVEAHRPQLMVLFKAPHVREAPVRRARAMGCRTVCIYPDLDPRVEGPGYLAMLRAVDEFCFTKPHLASAFRATVRDDARVIWPLYSSEEVGEPGPVDPAIGVSFVGHHSPGKAHALRDFVHSYGRRVTVMGNGWRQLGAEFASADLHVHPALYGSVVRRIYRHSLCTLGLLMEGRLGGWGGDEVSSRSVLVPATGGLLLHPRNATAEALFGADCPVLYAGLDQAVAIATGLANSPEQRGTWAARQRQSVLSQACCAEALVADWMA